MDSAQVHACLSPSERVVVLTQALCRRYKEFHQLHVVLARQRPPVCCYMSKCCMLAASDVRSRKVTPPRFSREEVAGLKPVEGVCGGPVSARSWSLLHGAVGSTSLFVRSARLQDYLQALVEVEGVWASYELVAFLDDDRRTLSLQVRCCSMDGRAERWRAHGCLRAQNNYLRMVQAQATLAQTTVSSTSRASEVRGAGCAVVSLDHVDVGGARWKSHLRYLAVRRTTCAPGFVAWRRH